MTQRKGINWTGFAVKASKLSCLVVFPKIAAATWHEER
jgi:hypothetical protein